MEFSLDKFNTAKPSERRKPDLMVYYGPSGSGKTYLAASASLVPSLAPVAIIDTEGSTVGTLTNFSDDAVTIIDVVEPGNFVKSFTNFNEVLKMLTEAANPYQTIVVDTIDVAQAWAVEYFMKTVKSASGQPDTRAAWSKVKEWSEKVARSMQQAPALGIINCHQKETQNDTGVTELGLSLVGKSAETLPGIASIIGYTQRFVPTGKTEPNSFVQFISSPTKLAKNRFNLPAVMTNVTMVDIIEEINRV